MLRFNSQFLRRAVVRRRVVATDLYIGQQLQQRGQLINHTTVTTATATSIGTSNSQLPLRGVRQPAGEVVAFSPEPCCRLPVRPTSSDNYM